MNIMNITLDYLSGVDPEVHRPKQADKFYTTFR